MTFAFEDLREGILDLFGEAQQRSSYFCTYDERKAFIVRRGTGASAYRCELCGSLALAHRCPFSDQAPPKDFVCIPYRPDHVVTRSELERRRTARRERRLRACPSVAVGLPLQSACDKCGARAPKHRCVGEGSSFERKTG